MKCPCCGAETPDKNISAKLWSYKDFIEWVKTDFLYLQYKQYDLENYFMQVSLKCSDLSDWKQIFAKIRWFIMKDIDSNGKFPVKYAKKEKLDLSAIAFKIVEKFKDSGKEIWNADGTDYEKDPIELIGHIKKLNAGLVHWNNPNFEFYIERALKYYKLAE